MLARLADEIEACLARRSPGGLGRGPGRAELPGGAFGAAHAPGAVHEWFADTDADRGAGPGAQAGRWHAPIGAAVVTARACGTDASDSHRVCVWIGRACWPHPVAIARTSPALLERSVFVDVSGRDDRAWAIETALRSDGAAAVVADGSRLDFNSTRRFQLAAEAGGGVGLLLRPRWEMGELSAARTRWLVTPRVSNNSDQRWTVELLRCKGLRPTMSEARRWAVTRCHATGDVRVVPDAADQPVEKEAVPPRRAAV